MQRNVTRMKCRSFSLKNVSSFLTHFEWKFYENEKADYSLFFKSSGAGAYEPYACARHACQTNNQTKGQRDEGTDERRSEQINEYTRAYLHMRIFSWFACVCVSHTCTPLHIYSRTDVEQPRNNPPKCRK